MYCKMYTSIEIEIFAPFTLIFFQHSFCCVYTKKDLDREAATLLIIK